MVTFPKYESYKDSGVEWLGEIPQHWDTRRIKSYALVKRGASPRPISDPRYFSDEGEYGWVRIEDVTKSNKYLLETKEYLSTLGASYSVKQHEYDLFLSIAGSVGKPIISKIKCCIHDGFVWFHWFNQINREYLFYIFMSGLPFIGLGKHGTQLNLNTATIGDIKIPVPSIEEQNKIVEFLDRKTSEIDQAIAQKQRLIELLQEQKAILINQAVTKGLNPNVPMCDRGVEWVGEIPSHWSASKIGFLASVTKLTGFEYTNHWKVDNEGAIIALRGFNIGARKINLENTENISQSLANKLERSKLSKGNLVVPCTGTLGNAAVIQEDDKYHINQNIAKIHINKDILPHFLCYWMTSNLFKQKIEQNNVSGMQPVLLIGDIRKLQVVVPPVKEQKEIVEKLNQVDKEFDSLIGRQRAIIELLDTFRKSCIASAVTGKIKV